MIHKYYGTDDEFSQLEKDMDAIKYDHSFEVNSQLNRIKMEQKVDRRLMREFECQYLKEKYVAKAVVIPDDPTMLHINIRPEVITEEYFEDRVGRPPQDDDMHRCNCEEVGPSGHGGRLRGHYYCGWCDLCDKPRFICGH